MKTNSMHCECIYATKSTYIELAPNHNALSHTNIFVLQLGGVTQRSMNFTYRPAKQSMKLNVMYGNYRKLRFGDIQYVILPPPPRHFAESYSFNRSSIFV